MGSGAKGPEQPCGLRAVCRVSLPALLHSTIAPAARPTGIASLGAPIALKKEPEAIVVPAVRTGSCRSQRRPRSRLARYEATLGLIAQHRNKLGAIVSLGAERMVETTIEDRGNAVGPMRSSTCFGMVMRSSAFLASLASSIVTAVQRRPASLRAMAVHTRADPIFGIADRDRNLDGRIEPSPPRPAPAYACSST